MFKKHLEGRPTYRTCVLVYLNDEVESSLHSFGLHVRSTPQAIFPHRPWGTPLGLRAHPRCRQPTRTKASSGTVLRRCVFLVPSTPRRTEENHSIPTLHNLEKGFLCRSPREGAQAATLAQTALPQLYLHYSKLTYVWNWLHPSVHNPLSKRHFKGNEEVTAAMVTDFRLYELVLAGESWFEHVSRKVR